MDNINITFGKGVMLLMALIWLRLYRNPEFILCVMSEASVPVEQLLAPQEGSDVGWKTKESPITSLQGRVFSRL
jgi:hypothetical protein